MNITIHIFELASHLLDSLKKVESGDQIKIQDRAPYPPDSPVEILPPIDDKKTIQKREAADREFWETL